MMPPIICQHCASEIPTGFKFCGNCGQRLDAMVSEGHVVEEAHEWFAPLIGRDTELCELIERWGTGREGETWIEIRGERGIGKTRLVREAAKRIHGRRLLAVIARPGTKHRPFGMARQ